MPVKGLLERLRDGESVIVAEGYLFEFQCRGYLKAGCYVPEVVLEHPELVRQLHREFVHAGSDVVLAFTYYLHREKLRLIGREDDLEKINRIALKIAREVADETGTLMAGNIANSTIYDPNNETTKKQIKDMFKEQARWAVEGGADFIVVETMDCYGECKLAMDAIKECGNNLPAVVTLTVPKTGPSDGSTPADLCQRLYEEGAAVVGLNCGRGPATMLPVLKDIRMKCKAPLAALPVVYRTSEEMPTFQSLVDIDDPSRSAFPVDLDAYLCSVRQVADFTRAAYNAGARYLGLCCGNRSHYTRAMAEALGRRPPASRYTPDMAQHYSRIKDESHKFTQSHFEEMYLTK